MHQGDNQGLAISLMGKEHLVACPKGKEDALLAAADRLNNELASFKQRGQTKSENKAILMVALNLCHEIISLEQHLQSQNKDLIRKLLLAIE